jgi:multidrug efflux pump
MSLSELCIRKPVFATVLSLIVLLIGTVSYTRLTVREYPRIDEPVVTVSTTYRGASADIIESQVSKILEDSLAGIEGIETLTSTSRSEQSQISVRFKLSREPDGAASDVRDRVSRVRGKLPTDIDEPIVAKVEADANPIVWMAFSSDTLDPLEISDYLNRVVKPRFQTIPGSADTVIRGERKYSMHIDLDRHQLAAFQLAPSDVEDALRRQNVEIPAGRIESSQREFNVVSRTDLQTPEEFRNAIVRNVNGTNVRIGDVASVKVAALDERVLVRFNGRNALAIGIVKQSTANPLDITKALRVELPKIEADLPAGLRVDIAYDSTVFIDQAIKNVYHTIAEAVVLVALVILFFLRNVRAAIIPLVTIPVSLIGAFTLMLALGFSINTLTLLALVLAIGLVVDDAIVVLENIFRHIEEGMTPMEASFLGMKEISFAVVAMTLTLVAVYAPVAFSTGRTGKLFIEFALTLAGSVLVSGFVALTLSPMMCSRLLRHEPSHGRIYNLIEAIISGVQRGYSRALHWTLAHRPVVVVVMVAVLGLAVALGVSIKQELSPVEDRGTLMSIYTGPEGASMDYMQRYGTQIDKIFEVVPEVDRRFVLSGLPIINQGIAFFRFIPWDERKKNVQTYAKELAPAVGRVPGVMAFPVVPPSLGQSPREQPISFVIIASATYEDMQQVVNAMMADITANKGFQAPDTDLRLNRPELRVRVDRDKAADANVQIETVGRTIETMLGGRQVTRYKRDGEQYDVIVQVAKDERASPDDISNIFVRGPGRNGNPDRMVPLASLLKVDESLAPRELNHFGQRRAVTIRANLAPGYTLGEALKFLDATAQKHFKQGYVSDLNGQSREFRDSSSSLTLTFVLALAFIYLVLSAQFESFKDPFIIMLTVPLGMAGALGALMLAGASLNVYSQIGLITLIGLITKNGILIVEFANQLQEQGRSLRDAVVEASELRLRPILMTTFSMVFGAIPLALASGAGAETRQQIGWVIVGGLSFGTLLTLFVIPTVYSLLARQHHVQPVTISGGSGALPHPASRA